MVLPTLTLPAPPNPRPNLVFILADDMGFSDAGWYGEIRTPNIDGLAKGGVRMAQFYNGARCCPTRASLLTGLYPSQTGMAEMNQDRGLPAYQGELNDRCATIAEVLRGQGYHTGMTGKRHLAHLTIAGSPGAKALIDFEKEGPISPSKANWPVNRGFEEHWGAIPGVEDYWDLYGMVHNETPIRARGKGFYYTDWITERSVGLIDRFSKDKDKGKGKPFFMYVAYTAPHWPMQDKQADIDHYKGVYDVGWDRIRETRYAREKAIGLVKPEWRLSPRAFNKGMDDRDSKVSSCAEAENKPWQAARMATYAAFERQRSCWKAGATCHRPNPAARSLINP